MVPGITHRRSSIIRRNRGVALLMVLLIVLAITIISAGFIARTDVELASGGNMVLRVQMDQLADSGLEHARGMLLQPQDVATPYWTGASGRQLVPGSPDYYDITVARNESDATDYCTYDVVSEAYRMKSAQKVGASRVAATVRLDPAIALWTRVDTTFRQNWVLHGDAYTQGILTSQAATAASLDGDIFATQLVGASIGQVFAGAAPSLTWPPVDTSYANFAYGAVGVISSGSLTTDPPSVDVWKRTGDLVLGPGVTVQGMLFVTGNLTIAGSGSTIRAAKNLPALYVGGNLLLDDANNLTVEGLAVVDGGLRIHANAQNVRFVGGLFLKGAIMETTQDASGNGFTGFVAGNPTWVTSGAMGGALRLDGIDDYVDCGNNSAFDLTTQITVAAWVKMERASTQIHEPFVTKGDEAYSLKHSRIGGNMLQFFVYDKDALAFRSAEITVPSGFGGTWHHVAGTFSGTAVNLYVDAGTPKATTAYTGPIAVRSDHRVFIGADSQYLTRFFQGAIDDVRIYNRALSDAEIGLIKNGDAVAGLVAQWRLNGPGSSVTILADPIKASIANWATGDPVYWTPAAGAFFRRIQRQ